MKEDPEGAENFKGRVIDLLRWRSKGKDYGDDWLLRIATARGQALSDRYKAEAARQWEGGNKGYGEWIE